MAIQYAGTKESATGSRRRIIYQSEALYAGSSNIQRVQSINYGFTVPRTDVNQYGQLGQIERIITEVPTVNMDFTYHMAGRTNEIALLGTGAQGFGVLKEVNASGSSKYEQTFAIGLADEGTDYNDNTNTGGATQIIIPKGHISSYSWTGAVGDVPNSTVNIESTQMKVGTQSNVAVPATSSSDPTVLRPGNVTFHSNVTNPNKTGLAAGQVSSGGVSGGGDLPVMGFNNIHVQSFTVSMDVPRESIQRLGDRYEYARVITFPIQATMSIEAIVSAQAASDLSDIVGSTDIGAGGAAPDPGYDIDIKLDQGKNSAGVAAGVEGMRLRFKNAKIEGHSISSSIGANKSITLDYAVQLDGGGKLYSSSETSAGFFLGSASGGA